MILAPRLALALLAVLLAGCTTTPTEEDLADADYGRPMTREECEGALKWTLRGVLRDPDSARYVFEQPCYADWLPGYPAWGVPVIFGYVLHGQLNSKNAFGGYLGYKPFVAVVRNGRVRRFEHDEWIHLWDRAGRKVR